MISAAVLAGCASAPTAEKPNLGVAAPPADRAALDKEMAKLGLKKGMTGAAVRQAWGEPESVKPMETPAGKAEVWTYHRTTTTTRQVPASMETVPSQDAGTGAASTIMQPVYVQERVAATDEYQLLLFDDKVIEWKQTRQESRAFN